MSGLSARCEHARDQKERDDDTPEESALTDEQCDALCDDAERITADALGLNNGEALGVRSSVSAEFVRANKMRVTIEMEMPDAMWLAAVAARGAK